MSIHTPTAILIFTALAVYNFIPMNLIFGFFLGSVTTVLAAAFILGLSISKNMNFSNGQMYQIYVDIFTGYLDRRAGRKTFHSNTTKPSPGRTYFARGSSDEMPVDDTSSQEDNGSSSSGEISEDESKTTRRTQEDSRQSCTTFRNDYTPTDETYD